MLDNVPVNMSSVELLYSEADKLKNFNNEFLSDVNNAIFACNQYDLGSNREEILEKLNNITTLISKYSETLDNSSEYLIRFADAFKQLCSNDRFKGDL